MRWVSVIATALRLEDAVSEAADGVAAELGAQPDLVIAFVSQAYSDHFSSLPNCLQDCFPEALTFGASASGVISGKVESESHNALVLMAAILPDVELQTFFLGSDPHYWDDEIDIGPSADDTEFIVLTEPFGCDTARLVSWLDTRYPGGTKIGGVASGGQSAGESILLADNVLHRAGAVVLALRGNIKIDTVVAQGCRPIGSPMFITRCADNRLYEIDGRPSISVLEELFAGLDPEDRKLAHTSLFLGIGMNDDKEVYNHGDFLVRTILGVDPETRSISIGSELRAGSIIQFHLRDAKTSASEVKLLLDQLENNDARGALFFNCIGRGRDLYGVSNHDTECFHQAMGDLSLAGFFGNGEIGPVSGKTFMHAYTAVFALLGPRLPA